MFDWKPFFSLSLSIPPLLFHCQMYKKEYKTYIIMQLYFSPSGSSKLFLGFFFGGVGGFSQEFIHKRLDDGR